MAGFATPTAVEKKLPVSWYLFISPTVSRQISRRLEDYAALFSLSPCHIADTTWKISRTISFQREEFSRYPCGASAFPRFPVYSSIFNERRGSRSRSSTLESDLFTRMSGIHRVRSRVESPFSADFATTTPHVHTCHQSRLAPYVVQVFLVSLETIFTSLGIMSVATGKIQFSGKGCIVNSWRTNNF